MDFKFQRKRLNEIPEAKILDELEKAPALGNGSLQKCFMQIFHKWPGVQLLAMLFIFLMGKLGIFARLQKKLVVE